MIRFSCILAILCSLGAQVYSAPQNNKLAAAPAAVCRTLRSKGGRTCEFPFTYKGTTYRSCTRDHSDNGEAWCAYQVKNDRQRNAVPDKWADCDPSLCATVPIPQCMTQSGRGTKKTETNTACVFPFRHNGITYNSCTTDYSTFGGQNNGKYWCSTATDSNDNHINGKGFYGFCPQTDLCLCNEKPGSCPSTWGPSSQCYTQSGRGTKKTETNTACVFPFRYKGKTYNSCTTDNSTFGGRNNGKYWCSTATDSNDNHINGEGFYGFCPLTDECLCPDDIGIPGACPSTWGPGVGSSGPN